MVKIKLTNNRYAIIDESDLDIISKYKWHYDGRYAGTYINGKRVRMHRMIMNNPTKMQVDHKNMNCLDNRKSNLRVATKSQNMMNRPNQKNTKKYKGTHQRKDNGRWQSYIKIDGKRLHLGYYNTPEEAGREYNNAAIKYFGEFARLNEIN